MCFSLNRRETGKPPPPPVGHNSAKINRGQGKQGREGKECRREGGGICLVERVKESNVSGEGRWSGGGGVRTGLDLLTCQHMMQGIRWGEGGGGGEEGDGEVGQKEDAEKNRVNWAKKIQGRAPPVLKGPSFIFHSNVGTRDLAEGRGSRRRKMQGKCE